MKVSYMKRNNDIYILFDRYNSLSTAILILFQINIVTFDCKV